MSIQQRIVNVYAPTKCISCGQEGDSLCDGCMADVPINHLSRCFICGAQTDDFSTCDKCRKKTVIENVWVIADYDGVMKQLVRGFKYERQRYTARTLARLIDTRIPYFSEDTVVVHIPTATSRVRARGYDHALLLAKEFSKIRGLEHKTFLGRLGQSQQMGSSRKMRLEQAQNLFIALRHSQIKGTDILIIDDILTTGSTLSAAAKELKKHGAKSVSAVVVGHHRS